MKATTFGPFRYGYWWVEVSTDEVCFRLDSRILVDLLGGIEGSSERREVRDANIAACERERARIEAACRTAQARVPSETIIPVARGDFASTEGTKLVLTFLDSKTAQEFGGWIYSEGYPERAIFQNTVTVDVLLQDRSRITEEARSRNGQVVDQ
jgi:hypothetical protein